MNTMFIGSQHDNYLRYVYEFSYLEWAIAPNLMNDIYHSEESAMLLNLFFLAFFKQVIFVSRYFSWRSILGNRFQGDIIFTHTPLFFIYATNIVQSRDRERTLSFVTPHCIAILLTFYIIQVM